MVTALRLGVGPSTRTWGECPGFAWIGQHLAHCDDCGEPYWEHRYDLTIRRDGSHAGRWFRRLISRDEAERVRRRWEPSK